MQHETEDTEIAEPETAPGDAAPGEPAAEDAAEQVVDAEVVEEPVESAEDSAPAESELDRALRERAEYLELAQRSRAELENYRKRVSGEAAQAERRGRAAVARDLIGALDNLERALLAAGVAPDGAVVDGSEPVSQEVSAQTALAEGVALVYREFRDGLQRAGIDRFDPSGEKFDPNRHEAVATTEADGVDPGLVVETLEKGYALGDTILRPARVVVSG